MKLFLVILFVSFSLFAQQRVLLHIDPDGNQEAIPLKDGEKTQDVIARITGETSRLHQKSECMDVNDTVRNYPNDAALTSNFGFYHQEVAFQWWSTMFNRGEVQELWWHNNQKSGNIKKATIRAWYPDARLASLPASVITKHMGYYKDPSDNDGGVTPYKPSSGDQWFYGNGKSDSSTWNFDPLGSEVSKWLPGGLKVTLDSGVWQGINLKDWGDSMKFSFGQLFGFTISNDTKRTDYADSADDVRMELLSWTNGSVVTHHSYKFYEQGRTGPADKGWHLRGDFEWGMFVVVYSPCDPPPKITSNVYSTTLKTAKRLISATITDDNPGGGPAGIASAKLFTKIGSPMNFDSTVMTAAGSVYSAYTPATSPGDTVYWYIVSTDKSGNRTKTPTQTYKIFKKTQSRLFIYNNAQYALGNTGANYIYNKKSFLYDRWSGVSDGIGELDTLLSLYDNIVVADGSFPARNVYPALQRWIKTGFPFAKKRLFITSQDYGCYITESCTDSTFAPGTFENDYLGLKIIGPQDQGPTTRPVRLIPQQDEMTNYLIKYNSDNSTTLWHFPTFELAFSGYPDFLQPTVTGKVLFSDGTGKNVFGVRNEGPTFSTAFLAFDAGALEFRSDTSLTPANDPKYRWVSDVEVLTNTFFPVYDKVEDHPAELNSFSLQQNYPNPFNPSTTIQYTVGQRTNVQLNVYNVLGQKVAALVNETKEPGQYTASFNGTSLSSGLYFYEMRAGSFVNVKKMMLLK